MATTPNYGWPVPDAPNPDNVPKDMLALAVPIDAVVKELSDRLEARESIFAHHGGDGNWVFANGLGEPVMVSNSREGDWQVLI